jgi:hypothetical protein
VIILCHVQTCQTPHIRPAANDLIAHHRRPTSYYGKPSYLKFPPACYHVLRFSSHGYNIRFAANEPHPKLRSCGHRLFVCHSSCGYQAMILTGWFSSCGLVWPVQGYCSSIPEASRSTSIAWKDHFCKVRRRPKPAALERLQCYGVGHSPCSAFPHIL